MHVMDFMSVVFVYGMGIDIRIHSLCIMVLG